MGVRLRNFSIICDYATPEKQTSLELHLALPIPYPDLYRVQGWLDAGNWHASEEYLVAQYPHYSHLIREWIAASRVRSEGMQDAMPLVA